MSEVSLLLLLFFLIAGMSWANMRIWWAIMVAIVPLASTFMAYDCTTQTMRQRAISLHHPGICQDPVREYEKEVEVQAQVVQTSTGGTLKLYHCKVVNTRRVVKCGFTSIQYGTRYTQWNAVVKLTADECRKAVETNIIRLDEQDFVLQNGSVTNLEYFPFGHLDGEGNCKVMSFKDKGMSFESHYLQVLAVITVNSRTINYDAAQDYLILPGVHLRVSTADYYAHDGMEGTFVWEKIHRPGEDDCLRSMSGLYQGPVKLYRHKKGLSDSYVLVNDNSTNQVAGLKIGEERALCTKVCYVTQIENILLCDVDQHNHDPKGELWAHKRIPFQPDFPQEAIALKSQMSYAGMARTLSVNSRIEDVKDHLCYNERATLYNKLQAAAAGNKYAFMDKVGVGKLLYRAGAVIYLSDCLEVDVTFEDYRNCTMEIPIRYQNKTMFVDPLTYTIQNYPTIIPCSKAMPAQWLIQDSWMCSYPNIVACPPPARLPPSKREHKTMLDWMYGAGSTKQIYTEKDQALHRQAMLIHSSVTPLVTNLANRIQAVGQYSQNGGPLWNTPLTKEDVDRLYYELGARYFVFFKWFGAFWLIFVGIYIAIVMAQILISCLIRIYIIYRDQGCGLWVLCSLGTAVFLILGIPGNVLRSTYKTATDARRQWKDRNEDLALMGPNAFQRRRRRRNRRDDSENPEPSDSESGQEMIVMKTNKEHTGLRNRYQPLPSTQIVNEAQTFHSEPIGTITPVTTSNASQTSASTRRVPSTEPTADPDRRLTASKKSLSTNDLLCAATSVTGLHELYPYVPSTAPGALVDLQPTATSGPGQSAPPTLRAHHAPSSIPARLFSSRIPRDNHF